MVPSHAVQFPAGLTRARTRPHKAAGPVPRRSPLTARHTLVLGGARSGKSAHAERLVLATGLEPVYVATAQALDGEMAERIRLHREGRGPAWRTVEEPLVLPELLAREAAPDRAILVDCLTLWLTNLMVAERDVAEASARLVHAFRDASGPVVLVSNEVGLGLVPLNAMSRAFVDHAGRLHQAVAAVADQVLFMAAGLPLVLKAPVTDR